MGDRAVMNTEEHRRFTRVVFSRTARVSLNGKRYPRAQVRDLSLGGVFVEGEFNARAGDVCRLEFFEQGRHSCLVLEMDARVVRVEPHGLALPSVPMKGETPTP